MAHISRAVIRNLYTLLPPWNPFRKVVTLSIVPRTITFGLEIYGDLINNLEGFADDLSTALTYYIDPVQIECRAGTRCIGSAFFPGSKIEWFITSIKQIKQSWSDLHTKAEGRDIVFQPTRDKKLFNMLRFIPEDEKAEWGCEYVLWDVKKISCGQASYT